MYEIDVTEITTNKNLSCTLTVTAIAITKAIIPTIINTIPLPLAKSGPTEDILRQCGHRAKALFNVLNCRRQQRDENQ